MLSSRPMQIPLNDDVATTSFAYSRTPAKALLKQRTAGLRENAIYNGSMTVKSKGKNVLHTPFSHAHKVPQTAIKLKTVATPFTHGARPLGDKTPFPNRQYAPSQQLRTPKPQAAKLLLETQDGAPGMLAQTPECLLLPSAARRRTSLRLPSATSKALKTPATKGNYWDVSDGDLELGVEGDDNLGEVEVDGSRVMDTGIVLEEDEIEYMPPKAPEQRWEPPFDMPDYKAFGRVLLRAAHGDRIDDSADAYYSQDIELCIDVPQLLLDSGALDRPSLDLDDIDDDDPFAAAQETLTRPIVPSHSRASSAAGITRPGSRSGAGYTRPESQNSVRSRSTLTPTPTLASTSRSRTAAAATTTTRSSTTTASTTGTRPVTRSVSNSHIIALPANTQTTTRRAQPSRLASSRPRTGENSTKREAHTDLGKVVEHGTKTANAGVSRAQAPATRDTAIAQRVRSSKSITTSLFASVEAPGDDDFVFNVV